MTLLDELQASIEQTTWGALTLDPARTKATPLTEVVEALAAPEQVEHLAAAASAVASAQLESFPENLFWDFDYFLASIHSHATSAGDYASHLETAASTTVRLMRLHGQQSAIQFRYVHDFMYGFDWARWVRRDSPTRSVVEPFGLTFVQQSEQRGRDILRRIDAGDEWYPPLPAGVARNPFPFSREPEDELVLYRDLAARAAIPVEAWRTDARPDPTRDFDALREERAAALGLIG